MEKGKVKKIIVRKMRVMRKKILKKMKKKRE